LSNATEQARSARSDARAFADAFAAADDAFTFDAGAGESRTLTLSELGDVLALEEPIDLPRERASASAAAGPAAASHDDDTDDGGLLTLAELGDVLARPASADADTLDFDFGTGTAERARRRTAARSEPAIPRRASGRRPDRSAADHAPATPPAAARRDASLGRAPAGRLVPAPLTVPVAPRRLEARRQATVPAAPRPLPGSGAVQRFRANPDRVALYAVLLGILLVLIAASSSSA
jgi:hypothetical protein